MHQCRLHRAKIIERCIPDDVTNARGYCAGGNGEHDAAITDVDTLKCNRAQDDDESDRVHKIRAGRDQWIRLVAAADRVDAPGDAGQCHQRRADGRRCLDAGDKEPDQAAEGQQPAQPFRDSRPVSGPQRHRDHRALDEAEQDQGAGPGAQGYVGIGKADRIKEQHKRRRPAAMLPDAGILVRQPDDQQQRDGAGEQTNGRETGRIDGTVFECHAAQDGIAGKREHRNARVDDRTEQPEIRTHPEGRNWLPWRMSRQPIDIIRQACAA